MKFVRLVLVMAMMQMLLACAVFSDSRKIEEEVTYKLKGSDLIKVFNITKSWFTTQDADYLNRRNFKYHGEWGGRIAFCSNGEYYCMKGGLAVAIPKNIKGQKAWQFEGMDCTTETLLSDQHPSTITCNYERWSLRYIYAPQKGIISYKKLSNSTELYELIGEKGLFASRQDWS